MNKIIPIDVNTNPSKMMKNGRGLEQIPDNALWLFVLLSLIAREVDFSNLACLDALKMHTQPIAIKKSGTTISIMLIMRGCIFSSLYCWVKPVQRALVISWLPL